MTPDRSKALSRVHTLMRSPKFEDAITAFLDAVDADPEIVVESVPCRPTSLVHAAGLAVADVTADPTATITRATLLELPGTDFIHGTVFVSSAVFGAAPRLCTVIAFKGPGHPIGVAALAVSRQETRFTRFQLQPLLPAAAQVEARPRAAARPSRN